MGVARLLMGEKELPCHETTPLHGGSNPRLSQRGLFDSPSPAHRKRGAGECMVPDPTGERSNAWRAKKT